MSIQLTVMSLDFDSSGAPTTTVYNKHEITLGRSLHNDVVLDRPEVSEIHAKLRVEPAEGDGPTLYITDLGSSNGTLVENNSLKSEVEVKMLPNERIIIGNYLIKPTVIKEAVPDYPGQVNGGEKGRRSDGLNGSGTQPIILGTGEEQAAEAPTLESSALDAAPAEAITVEKPSEQQSEWDDTPYWRDSVPEPAAPAVQRSETQRSPEAQRASEDPRSSEDSAGSVTITLDGVELDAVNFEAVELFTVRGVVTHKGLPLAGVEIRGGALGTMVSAEDGSYRFADIPEGTEYSLSAHKSGFIFDCGTASGKVAGEVVLPVSATQLFPIEINVTHKNRPLSGVAIDAGALGSFTTDEEGIAVIPDVPEFTRYRLSFSKSKFLCEPAEVRGEVAGGTVTVKGSARELFTISGQVLHRGQPLSGATVDAGKLGSTSTDDQGRYAFENVPEGEQYTIRVSKPKFRIRRS